MADSLVSSARVHHLFFGMESSKSAAGIYRLFDVDPGVDRHLYF